MNGGVRKLFVGGIGVLSGAISATACVALAFSSLLALGMAHDFVSDRWRMLAVVLWSWLAMYLAWANCGIAVRLGDPGLFVALRKFGLLSVVAIATCPYLWDAAVLGPS